MADVLSLIKRFGPALVSLPELMRNMTDDDIVGYARMLAGEQNGHIADLLTYLRDVESGTKTSDILGSEPVKTVITRGLQYIQQAKVAPASLFVKCELCDTRQERELTEAETTARSANVRCVECNHEQVHPF